MRTSQRRHDFFERQNVICITGKNVTGEILPGCKRKEQFGNLGPGVVSNLDLKEAPLLRGALNLKMLKSRHYNRVTGHDN
jgi:hypothetical protein